MGNSSGAQGAQHIIEWRFETEGSQQAATRAFALYARSARGEEKERTAKELEELCANYAGDTDVLRACAALDEADTASARAQRKSALDAL